MRAGILYHDLNVCGGRELVTIAIIRCLKRLGFRTVLICGRRTDETRIARHFGVNVQIDKEVVVPFWTRNIKTYFEFALPSIAKTWCDILINPFTSDILPLVDVTYIHYPKSLILREKIRKNKFWGYYYKPYQKLARNFGYKASGKLIIANSFFTAQAIKEQYSLVPVVIYPPVNLGKTIENFRVSKKNLVLIISRFSSEKELEQVPFLAKSIDAKFVILGSTYSMNIYHKIRNMIRNCGVSRRVTIVPNAPLETKLELLKKAKVYFHTMPFEHFGISIVEGMAAGCIPIVHNSGGPKEFVPSEWMYEDKENAKEKIQQALQLWSPSLAENMKKIAYRFREERFQDEFSAALKSHLNKERSSPVIL